MSESAEAERVSYDTAPMIFSDTPTEWRSSRDKMENPMQQLSPQGNAVGLGLNILLARRAVIEDLLEALSSKANLVDDLLGALSKQQDEVLGTESEVFNLLDRLQHISQVDRHTVERVEELRTNSRALRESLKETLRQLDTAHTQSKAVSGALTSEATHLLCNIDRYISADTVRDHFSRSSNASDGASFPSKEALDSPLEAQEYYKAAGWVRIWRERIEDLRFEHAEEIGEKREGVAIKDQELADAAKSFEAQEEGMLQQLSDAKQRARALRQKCLGQGIALSHRTLSSESSLDSRLSPSLHPALEEFHDKAGDAKVMLERLEEIDWNHEVESKKRKWMREQGKSCRTKDEDFERWHVRDRAHAQRKYDSNKAAADTAWTNCTQLGLDPGPRSYYAARAAVVESSASSQAPLSDSPGVMDEKGTGVKLPGQSDRKARSVDSEDAPKTSPPHPEAPVSFHAAPETHKRVEDWRSSLVEDAQLRPGEGNRNDDFENIGRSDDSTTALGSILSERHASQRDVSARAVSEHAWQGEEATSSGAKIAKCPACGQRIWVQYNQSLIVATPPSTIFEQPVGQPRLKTISQTSFHSNLEHGRRAPDVPSEQKIPAYSGNSTMELSAERRALTRSFVEASRPWEIGDSLLSAEFRTAKKPRHFFVVGKMFMTLWSESGSESTASGSTGKAWTLSNYGTPVHSKVRRFLVVKEGARSCIAVPVTTYSGQGVAKRGVIKSEHAIVHFTRNAPLPTAAEDNIREPMLQYSIRVDPDEKHMQLDEMSRVAMAEPHCIQHIMRVKSIGKVNTKSMPHLVNQFRSVTLGDIISEELPGASAQNLVYKGTADDQSKERDTVVDQEASQLTAPLFRPNSSQRESRTGFQRGPMYILDHTQQSGRSRPGAPCSLEASAREDSSSQRAASARASTFEGQRDDL